MADINEVLKLEQYQLQDATNLALLLDTTYLSTNSDFLGYTARLNNDNAVMPPGKYYVSFANLNKVFNIAIAVEAYNVEMDSRKSVQHTMQGYFVDTWDLSAPVITLSGAISTEDFGKKVIIKSGSTVPSTDGPYSFKTFLETVHYLSSSRLYSKVVELYFIDGHLDKMYKVTTKRVSFRASVDRVTIIPFQLDMIVMQDLSLLPSSQTSKGSPIPVKG